MGEISVVKGKGGLQRPLDGSDHVSGILFYSNTLPTGFSASDRIKKVFSLQEAEDLGITDLHVGETRATGGITVNNAGAEGDTILVKIDKGNGIVTLGTATVPSTPTVTTVAAAIVTMINDGTETHGFSASNASAFITVTAPEGSGVDPNSSGYTFTITITGTATASNSAFDSGGSTVSGVASPIDPLHYHVSEFFRLNPLGILYIGVYAVPASYTFTEITTIQNFAEGTIRQIGVYVTSTAFATSQLTTLNSVYTSNEANGKPLQIIYQGDISGTSDLGSLTDLRTLSNDYVSCLIGQSASGKGNTIYKASGYSVGCLGTALGSVSRASVHESIAWVDQFNLSDGTEFEEAGFANGNLYKNISDSLRNTLNDYHYIYVRSRLGISGTYFNGSHTATASTSDYATIENGRTIDKAVRDVRVSLTPKISSPLYVEETGLLSDDTIEDFKATAEGPLQTMQNNGELSAFEATIDPNQNVLSTNKIIVGVKLVPVGVAEAIELKIAFTPNL